MNRTIGYIRANLDHVGCDNGTALEMCAEIERLRAREECLERLIASMPDYIDNWPWIRENYEILATVKGWECPYQQKESAK